MASTTASSTSAAASATATCIYVAPGKYGYAPSYACNANYAYDPSFPAAVATASLFGLMLGLHLFQGFYYRKKFCWVIIMGAAWETASFVIRALGTRYQQNATYITISTILFLLAPLWINAFDYMVLGRMVYFFIPEKKLFIKATRFSACFVWLDVTSFIVQLGGGLLLSSTGASAKVQNLGKDIYMGGIGMQQFFILLFLALVIMFHRRVLALERSGVLATAGRTQWRMMLYCLYTSLLLITKDDSQIRIVYRLIEFSRGTGSNNPIPYHEFYMYLLDALPMFLALLAMSIGHPGRTLVGPDSEFPHLTRKEKKAIKAAAKTAKLEEKLNLPNGLQQVDTSQTGLIHQSASSSCSEVDDYQENSAAPSTSSGTPQGPPQAPAAPQKEVEMELDLPPSPPPLEVTLAERRARRQAILAKYAGSQSQVPSPSPAPQPSNAINQTPSSSIALSDPQLAQPSGVSSDHNPAAATAPTRRDSVSTSPEPGAFELAKDNEQEDAQVQAHAQNGSNDQISAADYDPSLDHREDEKRRFKDEPTVEIIEEEEVEEDEDDVDDMFALESVKKVKKVRKVVKTAAPALITTTLDSAADPEGYYTIILGEQLDGGRYQAFSSLGKGMFANVVRARVLHGEIGEAGREVAIKIVRNNESMYRAGLKEVQILNKLKQADPEDKKHIVRLERTFEHRGHLCMVFESLSMNLREVVKRFGKDVGLNIRAVRAYAHQLFLSLSLLKKANIMHADIKPDNILVNEQKTVLKLCDLGSASDISENDITPYLVSRFYRAPEIILGVPYDAAIDVWSVGCTLFELYTGKILFPGRTNNHMLLLMQELKGRFNTKMIKKAKFGDVYFDDMGSFESVERDRVTGADVVKKVHLAKPTRDLRATLTPPASVKLKDDENKMLMSFIDLLDRCLSLDPAKRITPKEALVHPFIRG
ncbi:hypothetical protein HWV62_13146 [Athelia sp. TMB]|nr:hypothetical protein HWV62_13146 [Athelia sp. TMB]